MVSYIEIDKDNFEREVVFFCFYDLFLSVFAVSSVESQMEDGIIESSMTIEWRKCQGSGIPGG